jgi:hypothetical protein
LRRIVLIALALVALAPTGVRAATWYRSAEGELRASCACHEDAAHRDAAPPVSEFRAPACCALIQLAAQDGAARSAPPPAPERAVVLVAVLPAVSPPGPPTSAARSVPREARGPRPLPDLFVRHCALLL